MCPKGLGWGEREEPPWKHCRPSSDQRQEGLACVWVENSVPWWLWQHGHGSFLTAATGHPPPSPPNPPLPPWELARQEDFPGAGVAGFPCRSPPSPTPSCGWGRGDVRNTSNSYRPAVMEHVCCLVTRKYSRLRRRAVSRYGVE